MDDPVPFTDRPADRPAWAVRAEEADRREDLRRRGNRLLLAAGKGDPYHDQMFEAELNRSATSPDVLNHTDRNGYSPLIVASKNGRTDRVVALLRAGALTTTTTGDGWTALHHAVDRLHVDVVLHLLNGGADASARVPQAGQPQGRNALHLLVARCAGLHAGAPPHDVTIAAHLIRAGCDPQQPDSKGRTPLQRLLKAQGTTRMALIALLESHALRTSLTVDGPEPDVPVPASTARRRDRL